MLERTARYLDPAGQGFLHKYSGICRSRKSLDPSFWKHRFSGTGLNLCKCMLRHEVNSPRSRKASLQSAHKLCLDFLYPRRVLLSAASCVLKSQRSNLYSQKRSRVTNFVRVFSQASHTAKVHITGNSKRGNSDVLPYQMFDRQKRFSSALSRERVHRDRAHRDYDRMWKLWQSGSPESKGRSHLMGELSRSDRSVDVKRALGLLRDIHPKARVAKDYEIMIESLFDGDHLPEVELICHEAAAQRVRMDVWSLAVKIAFQRSRWQDLLHIWSECLDQVSSTLPSILASVSDVADHVSSFLDFLEGRSMTSTDVELASFLLKLVFASDTVMREISAETVLSLTLRSSKLGFLHPKHYYHGIQTSLKIGTRPSKVMTMILYRNLRWHLSTHKPSERLLYRLLRALASMKTHYGVQYILDEFTRHYEHPTIEGFNWALIAFSRAGDVSKTKETFNQMVEIHGTYERNPNVDYKTPIHPRWVAPLLHAYARMGDYPAAEQEFERISKIYKIDRNIYCWNALLAAHATARNYHKAFRIWRRMRRMGTMPNWHTYGTLMGMCARLGDMENTMALCREAEKMPGEMPTAIMDTVVEVYCRNQRLQEAEQVAETCLSFAMSGSRSRMWNVLLWSHAFRADIDSVTRIHNRMKEAGVEIDEMTYSALMLCFVIIGRPNSARLLLKGLQRGRTIQATEFHYTLVLYGYVKEGNRDMVYLVYKEMEERFKNPGLSARLLMMRSALGRDTFVVTPHTNGVSDDGFRLALTEDLLFRAIFEFDKRRFASKYPRPGTNSLPLNEAFPSTLYEPVLKAYSSEGMHLRSEQLLKEYANDIKSAMASGQRNVTPSLRFLAVLMEVYSQAERFDVVQKCWKMALRSGEKIIKRIPLSKYWPQSAAVDGASPPALESSFQSSVHDLSEPSPDDSPEPFSNDSLASPPRQDEELVSEPQDDNATAPSYPEEGSLIPTQRFILSRQFSLYIAAMGKVGQASKLPEVVDDFQKRGFLMTSPNWLTFVRTLATSNSETEQLRAFSTFERLFMPHFPGWRRLARGVKLRPPGVPKSIDLVDGNPKGKFKYTIGKKGTRLWTKIDPTWMHPTYNVMIYLAATLKDFRERSLTQGREQMDTLHRVAPLTLKAIEMMPHLREKFQGVLLRNQVEQGDAHPEKRPTFENLTWTGGVLGIGGKRRKANLIDEADALAEAHGFEWKTLSLDPAPADDQSQTTDIGHNEPEEHREVGEGTLEPQDEHDLEMETLLRARKRELGISSDLEEEEQDNGRY